jgi:hypothetical protein
MKHKIIIGVTLLALVGLVAFVVSAGRRGQNPTAQQTGPEWKLVVTLPATNSSAALPKTNININANTLPKAK